MFYNPKTFFLTQALKRTFFIIFKMKNQIVSIPAAPERSSSSSTLKGDFALHPVPAQATATSDKRQATSDKRQATWKEKATKVAVISLLFLSYFLSAKSATYTVLASTTVNASTLFPFTTLTGDIIEVESNAVLIIDGNYTFTTCTFNMDENARIDIPSGGTLTANTNTIFQEDISSNIAWEGIRLLSLTSTFISSGNCTLRGSIHGLADYGSAGGGAKIHLNAFTFFNNYYHLQYFGTPISSLDRTFQNVTMDCLPGSMPFVNSVPLSNRTIYAVQISQILYHTFGDATFPGNLITIKNADIGIFVTRSRVRIVNTDISLCNDVSQSNSSEEIGIYATRATNGNELIEIGGSGSNELVTIDNCENGIKVEDGYDVVIKNNILSNIEWKGIHIKENSSKTITMDYNQIQINWVNRSGMFGICSERNDLATINMNYNNINMSLMPASILTFANSGIYCAESSQSFSANNSITFNELDGFHRGINWINTAGGTLYLNTVYVPTSASNADRFGIEFFNCMMNPSIPALNGVIQENAVYLFNNHKKRFGISDNFGKEMNIRCNYIYNGGDQMSFWGSFNLLSNRVTGNSMKDGMTGMRLSDVTLFFTFYPVILGINGSAGQPSDNKWKGNTVSCFDALASSLPAASNWFVVRPNGGPFTWITNPNFALCEITPTTTHFGQIPSGPDACVPMQQQQGSENPEKESVSEFLEFSTMYQETIAARQLAKIAMDYVINESEPLSTFQEFSYFPVLEREYNLYLNNINQPIYALSTDAVTDLEVPSDYFEARNWLIELHKALKSDSEKVLSESEKDQLRIYAAYCPNFYGDVVFEAWAYLGYVPTVNDLSCYRVFEEEDDLSRKSNVNEKTLANSTIIISPNPIAKNAPLDINSSLKNEKLNIKIYSISGTLEIETELIGSGSVESINLASGIYFLKVERDSHAAEFCKLIVIE
jgi:hypothetical protein